MRHTFCNAFCKGGCRSRFYDATLCRIVLDTLEQEYDRLCEKNADLWDKVDEAYFNLPDDYDFDNYDEAAFIRSLSFLTDAEKDALIADYTRLTEIDSRLCELYNSIWGNTGCESGICPL